MSTSQDAQTATLPAVSAGQVLSYLRNHPNFLSEHPQLISVLTPPKMKTGRDVLDMQRFMIERLRGEIETLRKGQRELIDASRINMLSQERVHGAVRIIERSLASPSAHPVEGNTSGDHPRPSHQRSATFIQLPSRVKPLRDELVQSMISTVSPWRTTPGVTTAA